MKDNLSPVKRLINLLKLDRRDLKQILLYAIFAGIVSLTLPLGIQAIINLIQGAQISTSWIVLVALVTLGVAFQGVLQIMQIRILENMQQKIFLRSSFEFAYRFPKLKLSAIREQYPPEMANRFFDTLTVQKGLYKLLLDYPTAILQVVFGLILLSLYHSFFIVFSLVLILLLYVAFKFTSVRGLETSLQESKSKYKVAHWLQEVSRSLILFKLSAKTKLAMQRNDKLTSSYLDNREKHFKVLLLQFIQLIGFKVLITAGLLVIGGLLVLNQQMNIGQFVAAEIIIIMIINSVEKLIFGLQTVYDILTSLEKIGEVVDIGLDENKGINPFKYKKDLKIDLNNISFTTSDGEEILKGLDLTLNSGDRVLIRGNAGSGKGTLLNIIAGLLVPTTGTYYINDNSILGVNPKHYRGNIGFVTSSQVPFYGTIRENICFDSKGIDNSQLHQVLKDVGLLEFIKKKPNGLQSMLQPEGRNLPRSVIKRIALARVILKNPKVILLKDVLETFEDEEAKRIIDYLTAPHHTWALVVVDKHSYWENKCNTLYEIKNKTLFKTN